MTYSGQNSKNIIILIQAVIFHAIALLKEVKLAQTYNDLLFLRLLVYSEFSSLKFQHCQGKNIAKVLSSPGGSKVSYVLSDNQPSQYLGGGWGGWGGEREIKRQRKDFLWFLTGDKLGLFHNNTKYPLYIYMIYISLFFDLHIKQNVKQNLSRPNGRRPKRVCLTFTYRSVIIYTN